MTCAIMLSVLLEKSTVMLKYCQHEHTMAEKRETSVPYANELLYVMVSNFME